MTILIAWPRVKIQRRASVLAALALFLAQWIAPFLVDVTTHLNYGGGRKTTLNVS